MAKIRYFSKKIEKEIFSKFPIEKRHIPWSSLPYDIPDLNNSFKHFSSAKKIFEPFLNWCTEIQKNSKTTFLNLQVFRQLLFLMHLYKQIFQKFSNNARCTAVFHNFSFRKCLSKASFGCIWHRLAKNLHVKPTPLGIQNANQRREGKTLVPSLPKKICSRSPCKAPRFLECPQNPKFLLMPKAPTKFLLTIRSIFQLFETFPTIIGKFDL